MKRVKLEQDADPNASGEPEKPVEKHMDSASEDNVKHQKSVSDELPKEMHRMKIKENKSDNSNNKVTFGVKFLEIFVLRISSLFF